MDRDLPDVLRELRMGTAQVGSPEQFFALVAPAAAAIRESLEAVPQATQELRAATNEVREQAADLRSSSQELMERTKLLDDAARAVTSSGHQIVGQVTRATDNMQRCVSHAGAYPQWSFWLVVIVAGSFAFWGRRESAEMRRRFAILEHNQIVIAQKLGIPVSAAQGTASSPSPRDIDTTHKPVRGRATKGGTRQPSN